MELKLIKTNKEIKRSLITPMPAYIIKEKPGQTKASYVAGQAVIDKLNATFGHLGWSWDIVKEWIQPCEDKVTKTRWDNNTRRKVELETPIVEKQLPVCHVIGRLTVYTEREDGTMHTVSKMAPGAQPLNGGQSEQENCFKGANTDALKKAATMFGIGLELYRDENEQYFFNELNYENPWTQEETEKHKEELEFIKKFRADYGLSDDDMNTYVNNFSKGIYPTTDYIVPDNITEFVEYLKSLINTKAS